MFSWIRRLVRKFRNKNWISLLKKVIKSKCEYSCHSVFWIHHLVIVLTATYLLWSTSIFHHSSCIECMQGLVFVCTFLIDPIIFASSNASHCWAGGEYIIVIWHMLCYHFYSFERALVNISKWIKIHVTCRFVQIRIIYSFEIDTSCYCFSTKCQKSILE